jgi:hypothetical protein
MESIASEIVALEDEQSAIDNNMMREYSQGAGLHPMQLPRGFNVVS